MAAIGYGKKSDFTKKFNTPAPSRYEKPNLFTLALKKNKGCTFGVSRSQMGNNNMFRKEKTVGPG